MRTVVVTSFNKEGFALYGHKFVTQALENLPKGTELCVVSEDYIPEVDVCHPISTMLYKPAPDRLITPVAYDRIDLDAASNGFFRKHKDNPRAHGRGIEPWMHVKRRDRDKGYSFRYDIYKFAKKIVCLHYAAKKYAELGTPTKLFWMDADIEFKRPLPPSFFDMVLPDGVDVCYLNRPGNTAECGFVGYYIRGYTLAMHVINAMRTSITHNTVFTDFDEWHDSYMFEQIVNISPGISVKYLTGRGAAARGHVFNKSPHLSRWMMHNKGDLKYETGR